MSVAFDVAAWLLIVTAGIFLISGGVGLLRFPEFFTRVHAASIIDTGGTLPLLMAMLLQSDDWLTAVKLVLIGVFLLLTGPTATHALAKAAAHGGLRPVVGERSGESQPSNC
ncbi:MAG: monovalent cation/H(+) antiporter subunit G [Chromatiales bacterium]|nr:monovalent cation/H(+) antiporter subunit G [Chromatiales bacterium]